MLWDAAPVVAPAAEVWGLPDKKHLLLHWVLLIHLNLCRRCSQTFFSREFKNPAAKRKEATPLRMKAFCIHPIMEDGC